MTLASTVSSASPRTPRERDRTGQVFALYVDPSRWGEGIRTVLLEAGLSQLRLAGVAVAELWVQEENARTRRFYEARSWEATGAHRANARGNFLSYTTPL